MYCNLIILIYANLTQSKLIQSGWGFRFSNGHPGPTPGMVDWRRLPCAVPRMTYISETAHQMEPCLTSLICTNTQTGAGKYQNLVAKEMFKFDDWMCYAVSFFGLMWLGIEHFMWLQLRSQSLAENISQASALFSRVFSPNSNVLFVFSSTISVSAHACFLEPVQVFFKTKLPWYRLQDLLERLCREREGPRWWKVHESIRFLRFFRFFRPKLRALCWSFVCWRSGQSRWEETISEVHAWQIKLGWAVWVAWDEQNVSWVYATQSIGDSNNPTVWANCTGFAAIFSSHFPSQNVTSRPCCNFPLSRLVQKNGMYIDTPHQP